MSFTYEIGDFISRIRVAQIAKDIVVKVRLNQRTLELSSVLYRQGFIQSFFIRDSSTLLLRLKYTKNKPFLKKLTLISTPGHRVYWNLERLSKHHNKQSLTSSYIVSTIQGLRTSYECLIACHLGGEVILKIDIAS